MSKRKKWLLVVLAALLAGLGIFLFTLATHGGENPTIDELTSRADYFYDRKVSVDGKITPGSVTWDDSEQTIRFMISDDTDSLPIVYQGIVPDSFKPGTDLVVEGRYRSSGIFEAQHLGKSLSFCSICH